MRDVEIEALAAQSRQPAQKGTSWTSRLTARTSVEITAVISCRNCLEIALFVNYITWNYVVGFSVDCKQDGKNYIKTIGKHSDKELGPV